MTRPKGKGHRKNCNDIPDELYYDPKYQKKMVRTYNRARKRSEGAVWAAIMGLGECTLKRWAKTHDIKIADCKGNKEWKDRERGRVAGIMHYKREMGFIPKGEELMGTPFQIDEEIDAFVRKF